MLECYFISHLYLKLTISFGMSGVEMVGGEGGSIPNLFHALFKICPATENTFCAPTYRGQRRGAFLSAPNLKKRNPEPYLFGRD